MCHMMRLCLQFSRTESLAGATWLLLLTTGSISSFFVDIYVPFNCEFLVSWAGPVSMPIYEVYKVAEGKPLNEYYYGTWNYISGLVSKKYNIFRRRSNLEGIVLKAITAKVSVSLLTLKLRFSYDDHRQRRTPGRLLNAAIIVVGWFALPAMIVGRFSLFSVVTLWYRSPLLIS